mmetsp:Transcript_12583/g.25735  ORF Transcript_12583/g.25735 Transcript_12583/m.25735 type:complete len:692 (+) Transcript_12583:114-2189(+)
MWRPGSAPPPDALRVDQQSEHSFTGFQPPISATLPISAHRRQVLFALEQHRVVVIVGETGSGKSTQIPKYLVEGGWCGNNFQVVCSQPRRLAAVKLSERVSSEMRSRHGAGAVSYKVRFDDTTSEQTKVKFVTDGVLVRESLSDPLLEEYSVVIVDEAHERNLNQDVLFGLLKKIRRRRPNLRIVICSATIDAEAFSSFFCSESPSDGVIISVDGRQHPVETMYLTTPTPNYVHECASTVVAIHEAEADGDILVFLPTAEDIERSLGLTEELLRKGDGSSASLPKGRRDYQLQLLPLYAALPQHLQKLPFVNTPNKRKAIFATSIAETSITLPKVKYVVDSGFVKLPFFDSDRGFERLVITNISKASANQRAGRAGRTSPGKCYRLYPHSSFASFSNQTPPEISRTPLSSFILTMKALGIDNIMKFDLLTPPSVEAMCFALEELFAVGAIDKNCALVPGVGDLLAEFPVEVKLGRSLLAAFDYGCVEEIISIAAASQVNNVFHFARSATQKRERDAAVAEYVHSSGDHLTFARIFNDDQWKNGNLCRERFLNHRALQKANEVRGQLRGFCRRLAGGISRLPSVGVGEEESDKAILQALTKGHVFNVARLESDGNYRTLRGSNHVVVSPMSLYASFGKFAEYVIFSYTEDSPRSIGQLQLVNCSAINGQWLAAEASKTQGRFNLFLQAGGTT